MTRRVVITGIGVVSAIGVSRERFWRACLEGRSPSAPASGDAETASLIVAQSIDRRLVALSLTGGSVVVLDASTGAPLASVNGDGTPVLRLSFDADGHLVIGRAGGRVERIAVAPA